LDDPGRTQHPLARGLLGLIWLNGLRFWLSLLAVSVILLAIGDMTARVIGALMLVASLVGVVGMFRRR
jgi:hypothetical protein